MFRRIVERRRMRAVRRGGLPSKCTHCAGPLRSDEVEWVDDSTVECPFCGTPVKTES